MPKHFKDAHRLHQKFLKKQEERKAKEETRLIYGGPVKKAPPEVEVHEIWIDDVKLEGIHDIKFHPMGHLQDALREAMKGIELPPGIFLEGGGETPEKERRYDPVWIREVRCEMNQRHRDIDHRDWGREERMFRIEERHPRITMELDVRDHDFACFLMDAMRVDRVVDLKKLLASYLISRHPELLPQQQNIQNIDKEMTPQVEERNKMIRRLAISASYHFGSSEAERAFVKKRLEVYERQKGAPIESLNEVAAALKILHLAEWTKFVDKWFKEAGVIREYGGFSYSRAKKPDIAEMEQRLARMKEQVEQQLQSPDAKVAEHEGLEAEVPAPLQDLGNPQAPKGGDAEARKWAERARLAEAKVANATEQLAELNAKFDRACADAEQAIKERDLAEKIAKDAKKGGPVEIIVKKEGKKPVVIQKAHYLLPKLLVRVKAGVNVFLVGPAGGGKTTAAEQVAEGLALPFGCMSVGPQTTKTDIMGYMNANGHYVTTEFRKRFEEGGIFLLDEVDAGNPGVMTCLNSALANNLCAFPDGMVKKHEEFRCIAAGNTFGTGPDRQYVGRQEMDAASIDRFNFMEWPYDEGLELAIAQGIDTGIAADWVPFVQRARKAVTELNLRHVVSPRASIMGCQLLAAGLPRSEVLESQLWKALKPAEVERVMASVNGRGGPQASTFQAPSPFGRKFGR